jgi:hypothetical protein
MNKINPLIFFNLLILIFIAVGIGLVWFLIKIDIGFIGITCVSVITLFLICILYTLNYGIPASDKAVQRIEDRKRKLVFTEAELIIKIPILEIVQVIKWTTIEAVFLLNKPPLDGEYHNFEYTLILNSDPEVVKYETQSWYNRINIFPNLKRKGLPRIRINDDSNSDFYTFHEAINQYLLTGDKDTVNILNLKFGNEVHYEKSGNTTKATISKPIKTMGFYKIFDRSNNLNDETLNRFREETKNSK